MITAIPIPYQLYHNFKNYKLLSKPIVKKKYERNANDIQFSLFRERPNTLYLSKPSENIKIACCNSLWILFISRATERVVIMCERGWIVCENPRDGEQFSKFNLLPICCTWLYPVYFEMQRSRPSFASVMTRCCCNFAFFLVSITKSLVYGFEPRVWT